MRYSKLLVMSASLITSLSYAACTGNACFTQGVDFGNQAKPSSDNISNAVLESAVGANNIAQAKATQDSIQSTMGNDYKNIDGITTSGNNKAQACIGKDTAECRAYNYYNDPLTKLSQQGIESAVGVASNLINKKIQQNVSLTDYCAQHPSDSICKMCKDDPSQPMCQNGNKCTTISYNTGDSKYVSNGCQIIGQRSYDCERWVDDVVFHNDYIPPVPVDGSSLGQGSGQDTSKTQCNVTANIIAYEGLTNSNSVSVNVITQNSDLDNYNDNKTFNVSMDVGTYRYSYKDDNNGKRHRTVIGELSNASCSGVNCTMTFTTTCSHHELGGIDWDRYAKTTINYIKPKISSNTLVVDRVVWKDNCSR